MKILYLTQFFSSTRGGGEVIFYLWAKELSRRGYDIFVIRHRASPKPRTDTNENFSIFDISPVVKHQGGLPPSMKQNLGYLVNSVRIGKDLVKKYDIDIIHANNFTPIIAGWLISRNTNVPLVTTIHDVFSLGGSAYWKLWASQFGVSPLTAAVGPLFERMTLKVPATVVHTVSERSHKDLIECGVTQPITVIPNGLDLSLYSDLGEENSLASAPAPRVTFIGRLVFYKNLQVVIRAFKIVSKIIPEATLTVIGDGPMREKWKAYARNLHLSDNIEFKGYVSNEEKIRILKDSVALVFPSVFEGFGIVALEAFACMKPVIASKVEPLAELIINGYDGYLLDPTNFEKWAEKITEFIQNPDISMKMGINGRRIVEKHYTIQKVVDKLEKVYQKIAMN